MEFVHEITAYLENKPGRLAKICSPRRRSCVPSKPMESEALRWNSSTRSRPTWRTSLVVSRRSAHRGDVPVSQASPWKVRRFDGIRPRDHGLPGEQAWSSREDLLTEETFLCPKQAHGK